MSSENFRDRPISLLDPADWERPAARRRQLRLRTRGRGRELSGWIVSVQGGGAVAAGAAAGAGRFTISIQGRPRSGFLQGAECFSMSSRENIKFCEGKNLDGSGGLSPDSGRFRCGVSCDSRALVAGTAHALPHVWEDTVMTSHVGIVQMLVALGIGPGSRSALRPPAPLGDPGRRPKKLLLHGGARRDYTWTVPGSRHRRALTRWRRCGPTG